MRLALFGLALVAAACTHPTVDPAPNRWSDSRLLPVLEAQERRDAARLCELLQDSSAIVREAAALAFASVQDSAGAPCLLKALEDSDPSVRSMAVFAVGFVADSAVVEQMAGLAMNERDSTVQRAYLNASFIGMQRNGMLKDPRAIMYYFDRSVGHERVRAADALRRLPDSVLKAIAPDYLALFTSEEPMESEAMLVRGLGKVGSPDALKLLRFSADADKPAVILPSALRALGILQDPQDDSLLFRWVGPGCIGQAALEALMSREKLNAEQCLSAAIEEQDVRTRIVLLGLAVKHGGTVGPGARAIQHLSELDTDVRSPFEKSAIIEAGAAATEHFYSSQDRRAAMVDNGLPAVVRQAMLAAEIASVRKAMMVSRFASREAQYARLAEVVSTAIGSGDAGLICAIAEMLQEEEADVIRILLPAAVEKRAFESLLPIRDLEAEILLRQASAKRDGLPPPSHMRPAFNHAIDMEKLRSLKQSQRYFISTTQGDIIIATDVNDCPGSSLAFDSLVTAGYYDGKYFHRMVPNFVVQGGCPRGDGYGGMPWTLRTEIGRKPFSAGSVGLASAGPDTESCQFFITHAAAPHLDGRYTRFGEVVEGMDVIWRLGVGDRMVSLRRAD